MIISQAQRKSTEKPIEAALAYAANGWPVIPLHTPDKSGKCDCRKECSSIGKHPRTINGLKGATIDPDQIRKWWSMWPHANIGVAMGERAGVFALDVDPRHDGDESLAALQSKHGPLPATWTQRTGGGGRHYIFRYVPGLRNSAGALGDGLDIRTEGGYIVASPSVHASGNSYEWEPSGEIADPPPWLVNLLKTSTPALSSTPAGDSIPEGERNDTLLSFAGFMRRKGAEYDEIEPALQARNLRLCDPPLPVAEVSGIARSVCRYNPADPIKPWQGTPKPAPAVQAAEDTGQEKGKPAKLSKSWGEFEAETYEEGEVIAFGLERGEVGLLVSLPNAGKTTLALNAALSLCLGQSFGPITNGGKARRVLYIDGETKRRRLQRDIKRMSLKFSPESRSQIREQLTVICEGEIDGQSLSLTDLGHLLALSVEVMAVKPDLIVIDTLASLCPLFNENDNAEQGRKIWRPLQKLARDTGASILVQHHVGKRSEDGQAHEAVYRGRGASTSGGFARAMWILTPDPVTPGLVTLSCKKIKGETPADVRYQHDTQSRWFAEVAPPPPVKSDYDRVVDAITGEMTTAEIVAALPGISDRWVQDNIKKAVDRGIIEKVSRGKYRPARSQSEGSEQSAFSQNAQAAQSAQTQKNGQKVCALDDFEESGEIPSNPNEINEFGVSEQSALPIGDCTKFTLASDGDPNPETLHNEALKRWRREPAGGEEFDI